MPPRRVRPATLGSGGSAPTPPPSLQTPEAWLASVVGLGTQMALHIIAFLERNLQLRTLDDVKRTMETVSSNDVQLQALLWADDIDPKLSAFSAENVKDFYQGEPPRAGPPSHRCWARAGRQRRRPQRCTQAGGRARAQRCTTSWPPLHGQPKPRRPACRRKLPVSATPAPPRPSTAASAALWQPRATPT